MNLPDEKVSEAIAAVMGICDHIWITVSNTPLVTCKKCGIKSRDASFWSAFTPDGIWQWKSYLEKEMPTVWRMYCENTYFAKENTFIDQIVNSILSPTKLVQYLFDNLDGWGYRECSTCKGSGLWRRGGDKEFCISCSGTGKVLTEKAKRFKAIVEGE
jgi:hypothetical protein